MGAVDVDVLHAFHVEVIEIAVWAVAATKLSAPAANAAWVDRRR
ncbi:MAG: hypothetical protein WA880_00970 [Ornithinimicrobium sp.]